MQERTISGVNFPAIDQNPINPIDLQQTTEGNNLFPVFLKTEALRLLIIGGGVVGLEKLSAVLVNAPATPVKLVSITICKEIRELALLHSNLSLEERAYQLSDLDNCDLIIAALNEPAAAAGIRRDATAAGRLLNVADNPVLCDFYLSAVVRKGDLKIAISTNGKSPTLAKRLKEILNESIPAEVDGLMENLHTLRLRLTGDFHSKVIKLNEITRMLVSGDELPENTAPDVNKWIADNHAVSRGPVPEISQTNSSHTGSGNGLANPGALHESLHAAEAVQPLRGPQSWGFKGKTEKLSTARLISWIAIALFFMILGALVFHLAVVNNLINRTGELASRLNPKFYWMVLTGFAAQIIAGSLGMGFGVICTTVLLSLGISLPAISSSIHTAETFASGVSGYSHWKFGNVNKKLFKSLILPGVSGAIIGAVILSIYGDKYAAYIRPILALYTLFLGIKILGNAFQKKIVKQKIKNVLILAGAGGFIDSFGGGGWGPLVTSSFIAQGRSPRYVVGSVSLSKFFVSLASALTFFSMMGISNWEVIAGLLLGGITGAPISAKLAGLIPTKSMFVAVGILVIICSLRLLVKSF